MTERTRAAQILPGTLEMLALTLLSVEPTNGWALSLRLRQISRDAFDVNQGSLYPALQKMLRRGWIKAERRARGKKRRGAHPRPPPAAASGASLNPAPEKRPRGGRVRGGWGPRKTTGGARSSPFDPASAEHLLE